jgi:hypothetical protein
MSHTLSHIYRFSEETYERVFYFCLLTFGDLSLLVSIEPKQNLQMLMLIGT